MGARHSSRGGSQVGSTNPFKLFEYQCPNCNSKRPIQYFYRNGTFLPQAPRVVCGECNTSVAVEPFKTVEYFCPVCKKMHKVRLPAKPIPLSMYNSSVSKCNCGWKGEVSVGRIMDVSCSVCWTQRRELRGVWTEDGDEIKFFCEQCQCNQRAFAREPKKKSAEKASDMEYACENCSHTRPADMEELLRNQGLAICSLCGWVGYPEVVPKGQLERSKMQGERTTSSWASKGEKGKRRSVDKGTSSRALGADKAASSGDLEGKDGKGLQKGDSRLRMQSPMPAMP